MGELRQQNLTSGLSPSVHDKRIQLQRAQGRISPSYAKQELQRKLMSRRSMGELRQQNLTSGLSPSVHDKRIQLQRAQTTDLLNKKIRYRPEQERLVSNNILQFGVSGKSLSPSVHDKRIQLQRAQTTDLLNKKIRYRPEQERLVSNNILQFGVSGKIDVDPSLVSRQQKLARAKLGDGIKQHLETRPGSCFV
eukprot:sb/3471007/